jgi:hypothetical protein
MNVFVFSSLTLALICASVGILRKTQLKQHLAWMSKRTDARAQIVERQSSYELNSRRMLWDSASHFSWGLTLSIGLFAIGIFIFLWSLSWVVALAVLLFACLTLCVIFSRDISHIYDRCHGWGLWLVIVALKRMDPDESVLTDDEIYQYAGSKLSDRDWFRLLSHAIMSRTSGLTASGADPNLGRLALSILGLGRLPNSTVVVWRVLDPKRIVKASSGVAGLGRVLEIVLTILKDRDLFKGSDVIPPSLWARVKGYLTWTKPLPQKRRLGRKRRFSRIPPSVALELPWLNWTCSASWEFNAEEACLLTDILSDQLVSYLQVIEPLRESASRTPPVPEEPLYSAFWLAYVLFLRDPPKASRFRLRRIIALAWVRLQLSDLQLRARLTSVTDSNQSGHEQANASFVEWADRSLQGYINSLIWDDRIELIGLDSMYASQSVCAEEGEHLFQL